TERFPPRSSGPSAPFEVPRVSVASTTSPRWLSLGPASRLVGVDPDTLPRWADTGRVQVFVTPGGHRRFDRRATEALVASRRTTARPRPRRGASRERLTRASQRRYARDAAAVPAGAGAGPERERYRADGRKLVEALLAHLDADRRDAAARERSEAEAAALVD